MFFKIVLTAVIGYLLGSVISAVIFSRAVQKKDVRNYGSGNAGATNMARVFGMESGLLTFAADAIKTAAAMILGYLIIGELGQVIAGGACLVGHCYPIFFKFRGGKGVSVSAAIGLFLDWRLFLLLLTVFFVVFFLTRRVSACSISAAVMFPVLQLLLGMRGKEVWLGVFILILVMFMHRSNIKRLIAGTEAKFEPKKRN